MNPGYINRSVPSITSALSGMFVLAPTELMSPLLNIIVAPSITFPGACTIVAFVIA